MPRATKRQKIDAPIPTREQMEGAVSTYEKNTLEAARIDAEAEKRCAEIREEARLRISPLSAAADAAKVIIERWMENHPEEFVKARSIKVMGHTLGFNAGKRGTKLCRPKGARKAQVWKDWFVAAKSIGQQFYERFVRTKEEPNKVAILDIFSLAETALPENPDPVKDAKLIEAHQLKQILKDTGVTVEQEQIAYIELASHETTKAEKAA